LKKNKAQKNWLNKRRKDIFFNQSKILGYRSRSAFKLIEMNEKFKFINKNTNVLDLGSSPGGWSQVLKNKISVGKIVAVDIKPMDKIDKVIFLQEDLKNPLIYEVIISYFSKKIDLVISDIAANTTGNKNLDSYRTGELCLKSMDLAKKVLHQEGIFLSKIFMGSIFEEIHEKANKCFKKVIKYKPKSSKKESKEIYIYCKGILKV
tara:strand:+ start:738 stop:1355 length:618 start_codon:yes stop_codon:yes gene_type:complete